MTKRPRHEAPVSTTLKSQVAQKLRNAILSGDYTPGEKLSEGKLAHKFKTSRVPIREALIQLKESGLVMSHERRGMRAPQLNQEDIQRISSLRLILEVEAIKLARKNMTPKIASRMKSIVKRMGNAATSPFAFPILDLEFHATIWAAADNPYLTSAITPLVLRLFAHKSLEYRTYAQTAASHIRSEMRMWHVAHHSDLLDLLVAKGDVDLRGILLSHIRADFIAPEYPAGMAAQKEVQARQPRTSKR